MSTLTKPLEELRQIRIDKLDKLKKLGINPYPSTFEKREEIAKARKQKLDSTTRVAGRITSWRGHGPINFVDLTDESGKIQLCFKKDEIDSKLFELLPLLDIGDFLGVEGKLFTTKTDELTVLVDSFVVLSKSLRPLPLKTGLEDPETRYRKRYVDMIVNPEVKDIFRKKAIFWNSMRQFLQNKSFMEVETPVLETTVGGANAQPFATHHNALDIDVYLRISMGELWQKRLLVGGFEKTFEIGRQFRNEGISREHLQDYTQMEFYWAYANYKDGMNLVKEMYQYITKETFGTLQFTIGKFEIDLEKDWEEISYAGKIKEVLDIDINKATEKEIKDKIKSLHLDFEPKDSRGKLLDILWKSIRANIAGPAFLVDHPIEVSPLSKRKDGANNQVERFQVILAGSEMGNGYSELNDPLDQSQRFQEQQAMREAGDEEAQMHDKDFVEALEYGMPPATGFGVSERLFAFLMNKSVRECVMFPLVRPE